MKNKCYIAGSQTCCCHSSIVFKIYIFINIFKRQIIIFLYCFYSSCFVCCYFHLVCCCCLLLLLFCAVFVLLGGSGITESLFGGGRAKGGQTFVWGGLEEGITIVVPIIFIVHNKKSDWGGQWGGPCTPLSYTTARVVGGFLCILRVSITVMFNLHHALLTVTLTL